jgi:hypothetical protein
VLELEHTFVLHSFRDHCGQVLPVVGVDIFVQPVPLGAAVSTNPRPSDATSRANQDSCGTGRSKLRSRVPETDLPSRAMSRRCC